MDKQTKGKLAENRLSEFLEKKNFTIIERNLRLGSYEVDIIAKKNEKLYVFEVKYCSYLHFLKIRNIQKLGIEYIMSRYFPNQFFKTYLCIFYKNKIHLRYLI